MRPPRNSWPNTDGATGALFIAQLFREMLSAETFESFRVQTLGVVSRLIEAVEIIDDVNAGRVNVGALEPALRELEWSLAVDPVASELADGEIEIFKSISRRSVKELDLLHLRSLVVKIHKRIEPDYKTRLEEELVEIFADPSKRKRVRLVTTAYVAHLVNFGYSKAHILSVIIERFFTDPIKRIESRTITRLCSKFGPELTRYKAWVRLTPNAGQYIRRLENIEVVTFAELPPEVKRAFKARPDYSKGNKYAYKSVAANDELAAATEVQQQISSIYALTFLGRRGLKLSWSDETYVSRLLAGSGDFYSQPGVEFQRPVPIVGGHTGRTMVAQSRKILSSFDEPSTERLLSAIRTSALARSTTNPENQLISLWSAVEVLLSDPPAGTPRIVHYVNLLAPCVCIEYPKRLTAAIYDEILVSYRTKMLALLSGIEPGQPDLTLKFAHLMFDARFGDERAELLNICDGNPLARHRLMLLHQAFFKPLDLLASLTAHEDRVRWQIHRIYRARNHLVHAGRVPPYLSSLVMNAFEYFRSAVDPVVRAAEVEPKPSQIDQIVREIGINYQVYKNNLITRQGQPHTGSELIATVFG